MKKILIFSDTHGHINRCLDIINSADRVDAIIHAGDYTGDAEEIAAAYPKIPVYYVKGNNDFFSPAPSHITAIIDGMRIYVTHGHEQRVKYEINYHTLRSAAANANPDLVIFGHTHIPYTSYDGAFPMINPGSVRFTGTYAIAEIENGNIKTAICEV